MHSKSTIDVSLPLAFPQGNRTRRPRAASLPSPPFDGRAMLPWKHQCLRMIILGIMSIVRGTIISGREQSATTTLFLHRMTAMGPLKKNARPNAVIWCALLPWTIPSSRWTRTRLARKKPDFPILISLGFPIWHKQLYIQTL